LITTPVGRNQGDVRLFEWDEGKELCRDLIVVPAYAAIRPVAPILDDARIE
jgi:hypothetical protein